VALVILVVEDDIFSWEASRLNSINGGVAKRSNLSLGKILAYCFPYVGMIFLMAPMTVLPGVYVKYFDIEMTTMASILLLSRVIDSVTDPLIGYFSDRYFSRTGTRKPFLLLGGVLFILGAYFLYLPAKEISVFYIVFWMAIFYVGWTLVEVPHLAWGGELAFDSEEKTKIFSFRTASAYIGQILFYTIPLLPFFTTTEMTPEVLEWSALIMCVVLFPMIILCIKKVPDGRLLVDSVAPTNDQKISSGMTIFNFVRNSVVKNKPLVLFVCAYFFIALGMGLWFGLIFIYVDSYLLLGEEFSRMFLVAFVVGVFVTPFWYWMSGCIGKIKTWCLAAIILIFACIYTGFLKPGDTTALELVIAKTLNTVGSVSLLIMSASILSDICDYSSWRFGSVKTATFFALKAFLYKMVVALGTALGLAVAGWYGFDPASSIHTNDGIFGLTLAISWMPAFSISIAIIFILFTPLNSRRNKIIRRRLDRSNG